MRFTDKNCVGVMAAGGYEWAEYRAWWADGRYWAYGATGCSCTSFGPADGDPQPLADVHALYADARNFIDSNPYYGLKISDYMDFVSQVDAAQRWGLDTLDTRA